MESKIVELLNQSIALELNAAKMYMLFSTKFPEEHAFWWELSMEEENHASLLRSGRDFFLSQDLFPEEILCNKVSILEATNVKLEEVYGQCQKDNLTINDAANIALWIETSAGEYHFQTAMSKNADDKMLDIFQTLNNDDKDHALRVKVFMRKRGIEEKKLF